MSDIVATLGDAPAPVPTPVVKPTDIANVIALVKKVSGIVRNLLAFAPDPLKGQITGVLDIVDRVVATIEPFSQDDVVLALINFVMSLFPKAGAAVLDKLHQTLTSLSVVPA